MYCSAGGIVLVFVQKKKYIYFQEKFAKNIPARAALFGSNVTKSFFAGALIRPRPHWGRLQRPQTPNCTYGA